MTDESDLSAVVADPIRCDHPSCEAENELLLHVSDHPWGGADLCMAHARAVFAMTPLCWTCECAFCKRARSVMRQHAHPDGIILCPSCPGRHRVMTSSGSIYILDLDEQTVCRSPRTSEVVDDYETSDMRRDGDVLPLLGFDPIMIGFSTTLMIGHVDNYVGYVQTNRQTTPVVAVCAEAELR